MTEVVVFVFLLAISLVIGLPFTGYPIWWLYRRLSGESKDHPSSRHAGSTPPLWCSVVTALLLVAVWVLIVT